MTIIKYLIDFVLHIDKNLAIVIHDFGGWSYAILWLVIFVETGLVVTPFLPGDSLLFAAGALTASVGAFQIGWLGGLMVIAAFVGDTVNYWIGRRVGPAAFNSNLKFKVFNLKIEIGKILKPEYLDKAQAFYDKHGGKAIILARFVPIVRTFAPFVAGIGKMNYGKFISYNAIGGLFWVTLFVWGGYFFGNIPIVKNNFEVVALLIILISVVPMGIEWVKSKKK